MEDVDITPARDQAEIAALLANDEPETQQFPADPVAVERAYRLGDALLRSSHHAVLRGIDLR